MSLLQQYLQKNIRFAYAAAVSMRVLNTPPQGWWKNEHQA